MSNVTPPNDTIPSPPVIPAGHAREALVLATANLASALEAYTSTAEAIARTLDETDAQIKAAHAALVAT